MLMQLVVPVLSVAVDDAERMSHRVAINSTSIYGNWVIISPVSLSLTYTRRVVDVCIRCSLEFRVAKHKVYEFSTVICSSDMLGVCQ